jgi:polyisoprenoid-binding protein YceI
MRAAVLCASLALFCAASVRAEDTERWALNRDASQVGFRVRLFALLPLSGWFGDLHGGIDVDRKAGTARVEATVRAASVIMPNPDHAQWVRSTEFFDAEHYPEIEFRSVAFPLATLADGGEIDGSLWLRGQSRAVRFEVEPVACALDDLAHCVVDVRGAIRRAEFGMTARRGTVSDRVALNLRIAAGERR